MILEGFIIIITVILVHHIAKRLQERSNIPPGPPPLPLIGNAHNVARWFPHIHHAFNSIAKIYGCLFTIYLNGQRVVVVSSVKLAREALIDKKDDFSGRPFTFTGSIFSRNFKGIGFTDFNPTLVLQRKIAHSAIRMYGQKLEGKVSDEADDLIERIKQYNSKPFSPKKNFSLAVMNVICAIVFGKRYEIDDPEFLDISENNHVATWVLGGILDVFPWLYYFPVKHTQALKSLVKSSHTMLNKRYREHLETYQDGKVRDLIDALIKAQADEDNQKTITEDHIIMTMQDVFIAGHETTTTTLLWMLVFLAQNPHVQYKVHAELDTVVGRARPPNLGDRENLHFLQATIYETLRVSALVPLLLPHRTTRDTTLGNYTIPKETMVFINSYAMGRDLNYWNQPEQFDPTRFLDDNGTFSNSNPAFLPFGAGRRVCVGESIAKREVFLFAAKIAHQFVFKPANGSPLDNLQGEGRIVNTPQPFNIIAEDRLTK